MKRLVWTLEAEESVVKALNDALSGGAAFDEAAAKLQKDYGKGIEALREGSEGLMIMCGFGLPIFGGGASAAYLPSSVS